MTSATAFSLADVAALLLLLWEVLWGLKRGLSGEGPRLCTTIITLGASLRLTQTVGGLLTRNSDRLAAAPDLAEAIAFLALVAFFALTFLVLRLLARLLLTVTFNPAIDRPGGVFAGILRGLLLVILAAWGIGLWPHPALRRRVREESVVGRTVHKIVPPVVARLNAIRIQAPAAIRLEPPSATGPAAAPDRPAD